MGYPHYSNDCFEYHNCVTICGSMRFYDRMLKVAERLTLEGKVVLMPFVVKRSADGGTSHSPEVAEQPDMLHLRKIDLSRGIVVVSDESGYIGDSTRREIEHAERTYKAVAYERVV